ncbi:hypothetical protein [Defluviimonas salinarum]|uniref:Uncharacterized protein n=1 Tax=Defluviimonas salinarum TaxID=2992147 RepID=A0ABT3J880_9RHOB|nr:hypothetical protein [Defluviimonas salinarum]MCW3783901.1 hypothetical protein [Defluviimonas salinarum]
MQEVSQTIDEFRATRREMSAQNFGGLVKDLAWEGDPETVFLVYDDAFYIEKLDDGRFLLTIENQGWITGDPDDLTLEDLEARLFDWAQPEDAAPAP